MIESMTVKEINALIDQLEHPVHKAFIWKDDDAGYMIGWHDFAKLLNRPEDWVFMDIPTRKEKVVETKWLVGRIIDGKVCIKMPHSLAPNAKVQTENIKSLFEGTGYYGPVEATRFILG